jgi:hypothetical protein
VSNTLYRGSMLEGFISDLAARTRFQHVLGDYEGARQQSPRPPIIWRHPRDRYILETSDVTDHQVELDVFAQVDETVEMFVHAEDYAKSLHMLLEVWRLGFDKPSLTRHGIEYVASVDYGKVRLPRVNEPLPKGVPTSGFLLIDLVKLTWLAPSQVASETTVESVSVTAKMFEGSTLREEIEAPLP